MGWAFPQSCQWSWEHFKPLLRPRALQGGEERFFDVINGERRSCVESPDGTTRVESPFVTRDGRRVAPTGHGASDFGPIGAPGVNYVINHLGYRITWIFDQMHRDVSDIDAARNEA